MTPRAPRPAPRPAPLAPSLPLSALLWLAPLPLLAPPSCAERPTPPAPVDRADGREASRSEPATPPPLASSATPEGSSAAGRADGAGGPVDSSRAEGEPPAQPNALGDAPGERRGEKGEKGEKGAEGPRGLAGPAGEGAAADLLVGELSAGERLAGEPPAGEGAAADLWAGEGLGARGAGAGGGGGGKGALGSPAPDSNALGARPAAAPPPARQAAEDAQGAVAGRAELKRASAPKAKPSPTAEATALRAQVASSGGLLRSREYPGYGSSAQYAQHLRQQLTHSRAALYGPMRSPLREPLSTFAIDVDTASFTRLRASLKPRADGLRAGEVRVEELINSFPYDLAPPPAGAAHPFSVRAELSASPWAEVSGERGALLLRVALKAAEVPAAEMPPSHLVFLVDVSGSMASQDKLPLVKRALSALAKTLRPVDRVSVVTYSGEVKTLLEPTSGAERGRVLAAIARLKASGQTAGGAGLARAYELAQAGWVAGGNNRVVMATDGDFNVGVSSVYEIKEMISARRKTGVYLSVLGFGSRNYSDANMSTLAEAGNGNYSFIDGEEEAARALVREREGTLVTVARDVKVQVEFNPARVQSYRLLGYKSRALAASGFNDDRVDGGELGAGQAVTALYEVIPTPPPALEESAPPVDALRYAPQPTLKVAAPEPEPEPAPTPAPAPAVAADPAAEEWLTVKVRYKAPSAPSAGAEGGDASRRAAYPVTGAPRSLYEASAEQRVAVALALIGEWAQGWRWMWQRAVDGGYAPAPLERQVESLLSSVPAESLSPRAAVALKGLRGLTAQLKGRY